MTTILEQLQQNDLIALQRDGGDWPRGFLSSTLIPDGWMALVEADAGWRRFIPSGEEPKCNRRDRLTLVRNRAIEVPLADIRAVAATGEDVAFTGALLVRWPQRDDDLAALSRLLQRRNPLTLDVLPGLLADCGLDAAFAAFARERDAADLLDSDQREAVHAYLQSKLGDKLFDLGLQIDAVNTLRIDSRALREKRARERDTAGRIERIRTRQMVEEVAVSATRQRLDSLEEILGKLKKVSAGDDATRWHDLLPSLDPGERGKLLSSLWRISPTATRTETIVAIAGMHCVWLDPTAPDETVRRIDLPDLLGPLRSVSFDSQRGKLLVGAAQGVWVLDAREDSKPASYAVPDAGSQRTGFNAAAADASHLYATHSRLGCWSWAWENPGGANQVFAPPRDSGSVRAATLLDRSIFFAADDRVYCIDPDEQHPAVIGDALGAAVHCIVGLDRDLYCGAADGTVRHLSLDSPELWRILHRGSGGAVESLCLRHWNDLLEMVIPAGTRGVIAYYPDEQISAPLLDGPHDIRRAWPADDVIVALNDHRDRLLVMNMDSPDRTAREVPLARMLGRSVQDVCLVPAISTANL
ncbi:MAG: hypothetical protein AB7N71_09415 [Phycisphaerae bacterium]